MGILLSVFLLKFILIVCFGKLFIVTIFQHITMILRAPIKSLVIVLIITSVQLLYDVVLNQVLKQ